MEEKWKKFLFRSFVNCLGAAYSYLSSVTLEEFAWKILLWTVIQALLSSLGSMPAEAQAQTKTSTLKKIFSYL